MVPICQPFDLYERACQRAKWHRIWSWLRGRSAELRDLATVARPGTISTRRDAGMQTVSLQRICGSEGRCTDFDDAFHPRQRHTKERWRRIERAWQRGISLPPVELILVGDVYFVRDGHHRISVARALGQEEIDAVVTIWKVGTTSSTDVLDYQLPLLSDSVLQGANGQIALA